MLKLVLAIALMAQLSYATVECTCSSYQDGSVAGDTMCQFDDTNCAAGSNFPTGCPTSAVECVLPSMDGDDDEDEDLYIGSEMSSSGDYGMCSECQADMLVVMTCYSDNNCIEDEDIDEECAKDNCEDVTLAYMMCFAEYCDVGSSDSSDGSSDDDVICGECGLEAFGVVSCAMAEDCDMNDDECLEEKCPEEVLQYGVCESIYCREDGTPGSDDDGICAECMDEYTLTIECAYEMGCLDEMEDEDTDVEGCVIENCAAVAFGYGACASTNCPDDSGPDDESSEDEVCTAENEAYFMCAMDAENEDDCDDEWTLLLECNMAEDDVDAGCEGAYDIAMSCMYGTYVDMAENGDDMDDDMVMENCEDELGAYEWCSMSGGDADCGTCFDDNMNCFDDEMEIDCTCLCSACFEDCSVPLGEDCVETEAQCIELCESEDEETLCEDTDSDDTTPTNNIENDDDDDAETDDDDAETDDDDEDIDAGVTSMMTVFALFLVTIFY